MEDNLIINSLWVGKKLSPIELLTVHSFANQGHRFHLWVYNDLENKLPVGVSLKDANKIIHHTQIFRKKSSDPLLGIGKGGIALFADIFRCKLLYEHGGWWVDMDMVCLKPLDFKAEYIFRSHPVLPMINNFIKCPKGSKFMLETWKETEKKVNAETDDYLLPNKILNNNVEKYNLSHCILSQLGPRDWWPDIEKFLYSEILPQKDWYFMHWMNENWRTNNLSKNEIYKNTSLSNFLGQYNITFQEKSKDSKYYKWHFKQSKIGKILKSLKT